MKKRNKHHKIHELPTEPPAEFDAQTPFEESPEYEPPTPDSGSPTAAPETPVCERCAEMESKYLRAAADLQNYAKRTRQNIADARQQQLMDVARALVTVLDHFDHALEVDPDSTSADALLKGVRIVRDELLGSLERFGVKRFEAKQGEQFDPNRHEAMMRQAVEGLEPDCVAAQLQPGYMLEEKTLRPAKVSVTE